MRKSFLILLELIGRNTNMIKESISLGMNNIENCVIL